MFETRHIYDQLVKSNKTTMRTRGTKGQSQNVAVDHCTDFTMHVSQQTGYKGNKKNLIDYSQHRLEKYIDQIDDAQQKMVLFALLHDYVKGDVALAWKRGQPIYIQVTKA